MTRLSEKEQEEQLSQLEKRLEAFSHIRQISQPEIQCRHGTAALQMRTTIYKAVTTDYYQQTLEQRRAQLSAPSVYHLCKSMLMKNTKCKNKDCSDPNDSLYYLCTVQYMAKLDCQKIYRVVRTLANGLKKHFHFRLAPDSEQAVLTGYPHGGVTPFGMKTKIPLILDERVTKLKPAIFFVGGGDVATKVSISVQEFIDICHPIVADIANPRQDGYNGLGDDDEGDGDNDSDVEDQSVTPSPAPTSG
ncbi:putative YbaK/aminoacyl-tRNA synthetase-associated domain [Blattamonas nauphoetae]|uniref:YbaK/aminoacyl-tRNA synthetase-associated domain n=1 Tax=Blattamonas nauphoetae TaxID=2049346 RepID=A0ABQ9XLV7_9EUKA|nr:putative YbaK/aminoacyl-tRNA synthetase-associated domain [Blattamonas nauphoetae]